MIFVQPKFSEIDSGPQVNLLQLIEGQNKLSEIDVVPHVYFLQLIAGQVKMSKIDVGSHINFLHLIVGQTKPNEVFVIGEIDPLQPIEIEVYSCEARTVSEVDLSQLILPQIQVHQITVLTQIYSLQCLKRAIKLVSHLYEFCLDMLADILILQIEGSCIKFLPPLPETINEAYIDYSTYI